MDWVYLAVSINGALYTINAYRPVKRNPVFYLWSFFASWITIELAWVHLVWQVAVSGYFVWHGALRSSKGRLAFVINLVSFVGLIGLIRQSMQAHHEIRDAFHHLDDARGASGTQALDARRGLGVKVTKDITYTKADGRPLKLDVYAPATPAAPGVKRPAIVQIHGGGWVIGDKREQGLPLLKHLADEGWVGFNVNYRLSPKATFPDHLIDLKTAVAWIREHADEYGIDADFIAVTGGSAGGHLCALMALTANDPRYQPGFEDADTSFRAAVPFYGVYDFVNRRGHYPKGVVDRFFGKVILKTTYAADPDKFAEASPIDQVRPDAPPFYVIHGDIDTLAPVEGARDFVHDLRAVSKEPVLYLELRRTQHAFEVFPSIRANKVVRSVEQFLDTIHADYEQGIDPAGVSAAAELAEAVAAEAPADITT